MSVTARSREPRSTNKRSPRSALDPAAPEGLSEHEHNRRNAGNTEATRGHSLCCGFMSAKYFYLCFIFWKSFNDPQVKVKAAEVNTAII